MSAHLAYWKGQLAGYDDGVLIPTDFPREGAAGSRVKLLTRHYSLEFSQQLERFSRAHSSTLFMTLLAGFAVVLHRYTDLRDMCIGVTTAGRTMPQLEPLIGFFINILPLRIYLSDRMSVQDLMAAVRQTTLDAFDHQDLPFEHLLNEMTASGSTRAGSLVPLILRHQNFPRIKVEDVLPSGLQRTTLMAEDDEDEALEMAAKCEIDFAFYGGGDQPLELLCRIRCGSVSAREHRALAAAPDHILQAMMDNCDQRLSELPLYGEQERQALLNESHGRRLERGLDPAAHVVAQFERHAAAAADKVVCYALARSISYGELNTQANRLAHYLIKRGVGPESVVGVYLERSIETLVALLAIFKAGGAYVPLDVHYPQHYLELMINSAGLSQILCNGATQLRCHRWRWKP